MSIFLFFVAFFAFAALLGAGYYIVRHILDLRERDRDPNCLTDADLGL